MANGGGEIKPLALIVALFLHLTGLWGQAPKVVRADLSSSASGFKTTPLATDPSPEPMPVQVGHAPLSLVATSAIAIDTTTGTVLYQSNADAQRPIASITKLVTTMVIMSRHNTSEVVTIPSLPTYQPADQLIGLIPGERYTVGDLVRATLIESGDDAADALALWDAGSAPRFAAEMNQKMTQWGIKGTRFSSASGLQDTNNYATARAVAQIANLSLADPFIRQTVSESTGTITSGLGRVITLTTTDDLLASGSFYGIKTGYTQAAGECFVGLTRIQGHEVITVVLGADDRFGSTQLLANWIGQNWQWL